MEALIILIGGPIVAGLLDWEPGDKRPWLLPLYLICAEAVIGTAGWYFSGG